MESGAGKAERVGGVRVRPVAFKIVEVMARAAERNLAVGTGVEMGEAEVLVAGGAGVGGG